MPASREHLGKVHRPKGARWEETMDELAKSVQEIRRPWVDSRYYSDAEKWTYLFWDQALHFRPLFEQLSLATVVELACGHGRHSEVVAALCERLILVDVIGGNLDVCVSRLSSFSNVDFRLGDGTSFPIDTASVDTIFCYDAMVHFSSEIVELYLTDSTRILRPKGRALFHHSNYRENGDTRWSVNPHARNYMTKEKFAQLSRAAGLKVLEQRVIPWGGVADLDCLTLVEKD